MTDTPLPAIKITPAPVEWQAWLHADNVPSRRMTLPDLLAIVAALPEESQLAILGVLGEEDGWRDMAYREKKRAEAAEAENAANNAAATQYEADIRALEKDRDREKARADGLLAAVREFLGKGDPRSLDLYVRRLDALPPAPAPVISGLYVSDNEVNRDEVIARALALTDEPVASEPSERERKIDRCVQCNDRGYYDVDSGSVYGGTRRLGCQCIIGVRYKLDGMTEQRDRAIKEAAQWHTELMEARKLLASEPDRIEAARKSG